MFPKQFLDAVWNRMDRKSWDAFDSALDDSAAAAPHPSLVVALHDVRDALESDSAQFPQSEDDLFELLAPRVGPVQPQDQRGAGDLLAQDSYARIELPPDADVSEGGPLSRS